MKNFKMVFGILAAMAAMTAAAYDYAPIDNSTAPGTVLSSGFYQVNGSAKINAKDDPGQSALRVAPGATVTIDIPFGSALTVIGGPAEGMIGAGAGIEVPPDAKLLVTGYGFLYAQGGAGGAGGAGHSGEDGDLMAVFDIHEEGQPRSDADKPLIYASTGAGGKGGNGGGGAGAGIGGRGGRGGVGGKGGVSRVAIRKSRWEGNEEVFSEWLQLLDHKDEDKYLYNIDEYELGTDGRPGTAGSAGHAGGTCGEIVIGEGVQVLALPGLPGASGAGGPYGTAFHGPDFEFEDVDEDKMFYKGLEIAYKTYEAYEKSQSTNKNESASSIFDFEDDPLEERKQTLWAFGGGGGGGGAGGAAPTSGIGPGGAGGGGGGGAGGGLFAFGANAWPSDEEKDEFDMNGGAGFGGQGVFVASLDEGLDLTTHGEDGRESEHVNYLDDNENFNYLTNRPAGSPGSVELNRLFTWSLSRKMAQEDLPTKYYQAGLGAAGGAVGTVKTLGARKFLVSKNATVLSGLEPENQKPFEGEVIIEVMLGDQLTEVPCGPIVSPVPVPDTEGGKFFMGYFTGTNGSGEQYYDCLGLPVGKHELWGKLQLYPHFADGKPADVHKVEFRYFKEGDTTGELMAWIWVQKGKPLPHVGSQKLGTIRGWRCTGAYAQPNEEDQWYDEDGVPVKEDDGGNPYLYDRDGDTVLRLEVEPKWEAIAEMPEDGAYYTYTCAGISGVELDTDEYEIVGGTSVATNVGSYVTTIRTKPGYELWDDFLEHPETATNWERTVSWKIVKADLDMLSLPNQVYNWANSNAIFHVSGKVPSGVTVNYEITKFLANGTMEIRADADGGQNFHSKSMTATWTIPELFRIEKVVSHYPWDTTVEIDVRVNPAYGPSVYTNRLASKIMPVAALSNSQEYGDAGYTFFSNRTCLVAEAYRGAGTVVLDMKEALENGRDRVSLFLTIDDVPCSLPVEVGVDTTAEVDPETGAPLYQITDPAQMFPINHSWRFVEPAKRNAQAVTSLAIDEWDWTLVEPFRPVNELGLRVNDGVVRWIPQPNGYEGVYDQTDYMLKLEIDCGGGFTTNLTAKFHVEYPDGTELPIVAYVGETGYTSLELAWQGLDEQELWDGKDRIIRVVGDVQTEANVIQTDPDTGATVILERGGVIDVTRQFSVPEDEAARYNDVHALVKYEWEESGGYIPVDPPPPTPIDPVEPTEVIPAECEPGPHDFQPVALAAMPDGQNAGLMELCTKCDVARVRTVPGVSFTLPDAAGLTYVVSNLTAGAEGKVRGEGEEGGVRYVVLPGSDIGIYAVAKPGYVVTGAPYEIRPVPADFVLDPDKLQKATAIRYQIAYEPGAGEGVSETNSVAYDAEHTVRTVGFGEGELDFFLTGHSFAGVWTNLAAETSIVAGEAISNLTTAGEICVFEPVWTQNVYSVIYRKALNETEGEVVTNVAYGAEFAIISNCFSEAGYVFGGWVRQDGVHGLYQPGEVVSNLVESGELVLCPVWHAGDYTVTYKPGDGLGEDVVQTNTYGVESRTLTADEAEMVRDHYVLTGWTSALGPDYGLGEAFSNLTAEVGGNIDFTAKWTQNEFPVVIGELPEHVRVQVVQDDRQVLKEEGGYFVTNGTATVYFIALDDYLFDVEPVSEVHAVEVTVDGAATDPVQCPNLLTPAPWMGGTLAWDEGCATAQLSMAVTNGTAAAVTNLIFAFEDRADGSVLLTEGGEVAPVLREDEAWFRPGVTNTWRYVTVTGEALNLVKNGETGVVTVRFDLKKAGITPDEAAKHLSWIGWTAYGTRLYAPVCSWADEIAEYLPVFPSPVSESDMHVIAGSYTVSYDGAGAAGAMAEDLFLMDTLTNLTANAYTAVGYTFKGWTTNGVDVAYADKASGVNFAEPGETLVLTALWDDTGVTVTTFAELTNALVTATNQTAALPVRVILPADIVFPAGGCVTVYAGDNLPDITFGGTGKIDVSGIVPQFGEPVVVGEGFAETDLALFDAKGVSWPVYVAEGGKVVLHARGEAEGFPWILDEENGVTAWVDPALTNIAAVVIDNGLQAETNAIDLVALTNNLAIYGYEPALPLEKFNALLKFANAEGVGYVVPVEWDDLDGNGYGTLADALAAGVTEVIPDFVITEETPKVIAETAEAEDGETYTAVVENNPHEGVEEPVKAVYVDGLIDLATNEQKNVTLKVESKDAEAVNPDVAKAISNKLEEVSIGGKGFSSVAFVDLSVFFNAEKQENCELDSLITLHIPWPVVSGGTYGVVRMHNGVAQAIPQGADKAVDGEFFTVDFENREIALRVKKFSDYAVAETPPGVKVGEKAYALVGDDRICTIYGTGSATNFPATFGFDDRNSITNAVVADGITEIGARFFKNFNNLNTLKVGRDVAKFGEKAFLYCMSLESIAIDNPNFDLSCLDGAISYHTAIRSDGSLYPIPNVTVNGCQQTLEGKAALTDASWTDLGAVVPGKPMADYTGYHFFRIVLKKVEE